MKNLLLIFGFLTFSTFAQESSSQFEKRQDSLRSELLKSKTDKVLRNTIFEELYIRGLVSNEFDSLKFRFPFNLHALDCGAPDCYTTQLSFSISNNLPIELPKVIKISGHEYGCLEKETRWISDFELFESDSGMVNYYSANLKSNLIFTIDGQLMYFPHLKDEPVTLKKIDEMYENWVFDTAEIVPFKSTIMEGMDYEVFLEKN